MPYTGPGRRRATVATKPVNHGNPSVENNFAGIAAKSAQLPPFMDPTTPATQVIWVGETFVLMMGGIHGFPSALLPGGAGVGTQLWIAAADNSLQSSAASGRVKFGIVDSIDTNLGMAYVNLDARSMF